MRLGLIGYGAIAQTLLEMIDDALGVEAVLLLVRPERAATAPTWIGDAVPVIVVSDAATLLAASPDLVVECAGHAAVADYAPTILEAGVDLIVASVGALAEDELAERLRMAARSGDAQMILPAGAVGGVDALAALQAAGAIEVRYKGAKPPKAWIGSAAEETLDLATLTAPTTFFEGTAREAARRFPKNANVAATLALAGAGFDSTRVELVADPDAAGAIHAFEAITPAGRIEMRIENTPSRNARTSLSTVLSVLRAIRNRQGPVAI